MTLADIGLIALSIIGAIYALCALVMDTNEYKRRYWRKRNGYD